MSSILLTAGYPSGEEGDVGSHMDNGKIEIFYRY